MAKSAPTYADLKRELKRGSVRPVYVLYGDEDFLMDEALESIMTLALAGADRGFNLDVMHGADADGRDIVARASSFPMMAERRVVAVREADKLGTRDAELVSAYVDHPSISTCLILAGTKPDFRRRPFSTVRKEGGAFEFKPLRERDIAEWIAGRVAQEGRTIASEGASLLTASVSSSLRDLRNELDKLIVYAGDRREITRDDVAAVAGMSKEHNIFEFQRAVADDDAARAVTVMERMLDGGTKIPVIIATLTTFYANLWKLRNPGRRHSASKESPSAPSPFFAREYGEFAQNLPQGVIERAFRALIEADISTKTSTLDTGQIMLSLVLQLCGKEHEGEGADAGNPGRGAEV
ncbi:MAG: DNA polymerase III subunit delta [Bacteroidota bacterium]